MPLLTRSREASFLYSTDFRTGMNTFSRGALMAAETDERIGTKTQGRKSLRDGLRARLEWSARTQKAFEIEEMAGERTTGSGRPRHLGPLVAPQPATRMSRPFMN
jgi:hypothetical protein